MRQCVQPSPLSYNYAFNESLYRMDHAPHKFDT